MAHNNSTPASVLEAPKFSPVVIYPNLGFTRSERRHGLTYKHSPEEMAARQAAGKNVPFVKAAAR